ncbi:excalibur calcium-binding domain-containing protein [Nonomuraea wenchangensis]|uniref:Excalibur calcium-binding domain-containing protein n=1 Tax=Nonomuraea wenchangensis TaxID=568860 RepID=A0A1I0A4L1_9ACTN|nr:excalibur calcium-binding domain-containing protein [Nonomuraea wenchangensis]SES89024.1 Excalibur calcium-binding domain-containing protein [Nonomuraea wenchangensis]
MDKPEAQPPADPEEPQASRLTTIVLIVSLVLVVLVAGVLGTVAVLMTRNPDQPLLGGAPPVRLAVPLHFAPVKESKPAPCPGEQAVLDEEQRTCYLLEDGVTVLSVQRIEPIREKDGQYSVRIAVAAGFKDKLVELVDELEPDQRQLAVVLAPAEPEQPKTVVAAPVVTEPMSGDSLRIAGFTKEEADALSARLLGPSAGASPPASQPATDPGTPTNPGTDPGASPPVTPPASSGTDPGAATSPASDTGSGGNDPRYASCKEAVAHGYGPYSKDSHAEYSWYPDKDGNGVACNSGDME